MGKRRLWVGVSLAVIAISLVILGTKGIRRGIDVMLAGKAGTQ